MLQCTAILLHSTKNDLNYKQQCLHMLNQEADHHFSIEISWMNLLIIHWSLSKSQWKVSEQISLFQIKYSAEQQILIDYLSKRWVSAQIPIEENSHFQWCCAEAWKTSLAWIAIDSNQSLQQKWVANAKLLDSHVETYFDWRSTSTFDWKIFWAIC